MPKKGSGLPAEFRKCELCETEFMIWPAQVIYNEKRLKVRTGRFCSKECSYQYRREAKGQPENRYHENARMMKGSTQ